MMSNNQSYLTPDLIAADRKVFEKPPVGERHAFARAKWARHITDCEINDASGEYFCLDCDDLNGKMIAAKAADEEAKRSAFTIHVLRKALWNHADTLEVASSLVEAAQGRPVWKRGRNAVSDMRKLAREESDV